MKILEVGEHRFNNEAKLLALLKSVGEEGRETLLSEGLTIDSPAISYAVALRVLKKHYEKQESLYVRTQRFVTVRQTVDEYYSSYLRRVEKLSWDLDFFNSHHAVSQQALQDARGQLALVLAVNDLRDQVLCRELIAKEHLTWEMLGTILRSRSVAQESVSVLTGDTSNTEVKVNREVNLVESRSRAGEGGDNSSHSPKRTCHRKSRWNSCCYDDSSGSHDTYREYKSPYRDCRRGRKERQPHWRYGSNESCGSSRDSDTRRSGYGRDCRSREKYRHERSRSPHRHTSRSPRWQRSRYISNRDSGCFECGSVHHLVKDCPQAQCYKCGRCGHLANSCETYIRCWRCGEYHFSRDRCYRSPNPYPPYGCDGRSVHFLNTVSGSTDPG